MPGLMSAAAKVQAQGRHGDTLLAHITPGEAALLKARGGSGTRNPKTGLLEFWDGYDGHGYGGGEGLSSQDTTGNDGGMHGGHGFGAEGPGAVNAADHAAADAGRGAAADRGDGGGRTVGQVLFDTFRGAVTGFITGGPGGALIGAGMGAANIPGPMDLAISLSDKHLGTNIGGTLGDIGKNIDKSLDIGPNGSGQRNDGHANEMTGTPGVDTNGAGAARAPGETAGMDAYTVLSTSPPVGANPPATAAPAQASNGLLTAQGLTDLQQRQATRGLLTPSDRFSTSFYFDPAVGRIVNR